MSRSVTETSQQYPCTVDLTESERHRLLAVRRRRELLAALVDEETPMALSRLAVAVARREGLDPTEPTTLDRVTISLHHVHLPLMVEFGLLEYDQETNVIEM